MSRNFITHLTRRRAFKKSRFFRPTKGGRLARSRRIFKRFIRRRAVRPELKFSDNVFTSGPIGSQSTATAAFYTQAVTPLTLAPGTGVGTRIGSQVNFVKVDFRMFIVDDSNQTFPLNAPVLCSYPIRLIIWTPRRPYLQAAAHVQGLNVHQLPNYDILTVFKDITFNLSPTYVAETTSNEPGAASSNASILRTFKLMFPRKVKLTDANSDLDPQTDILYATWICNSVGRAGVQVYCDAKTWFFDA